MSTALASFTTVFASGGPAMPTAPPPLCTTVIPAAAEVVALRISDAPVVTLQSAATLFIDCPTSTQDPNPSESTLDLSLINVDLDDVLAPEYFEYRDPFLASTFPICYALAATTITAWMLLMVLFMTPRIFLDGGIVYLGRWGFTNGSGGVHIGGRPWLQKLAVFLVAVTLTIASVTTFEIAKSQYAWGVQNASLLQKEVMGGTAIKSTGLVADTFLWLAQAQTLIRLFPRHRDRVFIKWAAFCFIALDSLFSALNSFVGIDNGAQGNSRPRSFVEPLSTISYLLHLVLGVIYAGWVMYYVFTKRQYAFYHPLMRNMCLVASISLTSVLTPVGFFILDISKPNVTTWSEYVRWVSAAAASVVVWEWVERIEELEREEKKDGILGRELIDGDDEGLAIDAVWKQPKSKFLWMFKRSRRRGGHGGRGGGGRGDGGGGDGDDDDDDGGGSSPSSSNETKPIPFWPGVESTSAPARNHTRSVVDSQAPLRDAPTPRTAMGPRGGVGVPLVVAHRFPALTPSTQRTDTPSTQYTVRYQPTESTMRTPDPILQAAQAMPAENITSANQASNDEFESAQPSSAMEAAAAAEASSLSATQRPPPQAGQGLDSFDPDVSRPQTRMRSSIFRRPDHPPAVIAQHGMPLAPPSWRQSGGGLAAPREPVSRWDVVPRIEEFVASRAERLRERMRAPVELDDLPVTVIPAPPRDGELLRQAMEEMEREREEEEERGRGRSWQ